MWLQLGNGDVFQKSLRGLVTLENIKLMALLGVIILFSTQESMVWSKWNSNSSSCISQLGMCNSAGVQYGVDYVTRTPLCIPFSSDNKCFSDDRHLSCLTDTMITHELLAKVASKSPQSMHLIHNESCIETSEYYWICRQLEYCGADIRSVFISTDYSFIHYGEFSTGFAVILLISNDRMGKMLQRWKTNDVLFKEESMECSICLRQMLIIREKSQPTASYRISVLSAQLGAASRRISHSIRHGAENTPMTDISTLPTQNDVAQAITATGGGGGGGIGVLSSIRRRDISGRRSSTTCTHLQSPVQRPSIIYSVVLNTTNEIEVIGKRRSILMNEMIGSGAAAAAGGGIDGCNFNGNGNGSSKGCKGDKESDIREVEEECVTVINSGNNSGRQSGNNSGRQSASIIIKNQISKVESFDEKLKLKQSNSMNSNSILNSNDGQQEQRQNSRTNINSNNNNNNSRSVKVMNFSSKSSNETYDIEREERKSTSNDNDTINNNACTNSNVNSNANVNANAHEDLRIESLETGSVHRIGEYKIKPKVVSERRRRRSSSKVSSDIGESKLNANVSSRSNSSTTSATTVALPCDGDNSGRRGCHDNKPDVMTPSPLTVATTTTAINDNTTTITTTGTSQEALLQPFPPPPSQRQSITASDYILAQVPCGHVFHRACIEEWAKTYDSCPMCRRDLRTGQEEMAEDKESDSEANDNYNDNDSDVE
eukprot:gene4573-9089_t